MLIRFTFILFVFSFNFLEVSAQNQYAGNWYATDGSNELILLVQNDFALYQTEFWETEIKGENLILSKDESSIKLTIKSSDDKFLLDDGEQERLIQNFKSVDVSNRSIRNTDLSDKFLINDQVVIRGVVKPSDKMPSTVSVIYNHAFSDDQRKYISDVDSEGRFKLIFPLDYPQSVMIRVGSANTSIFSYPGSRQGMFIDESNFGTGIDSWYEQDPLDYMGDLAAENEEIRLLSPEYLKIRKYFENDSLQKAYDAEQYQNYRLNLWDTHKSFYQSYFDSIPTSAFTQEVSLRGARIYAADDMMRYIWMHDNQSRVNVSEDYLEKVKSLVEDDKRELLARDYPALIGEFSMNSVLRNQEEIGKLSQKYIFEYLETLDFDNEVKESIQLWKSGAAIEDTAKLNRLNQKIQAVFAEDASLLSEFYGLAQWDFLLQNKDQFAQLQWSSLVAVFLDSNFLSRGIDIPENIQNSLSSLGLYDYVKESISASIDQFDVIKNKKFVEGVEISNSTDNLLSELKSKYEGKVVYIDVWATWCGPCISEFQSLPGLDKDALDEVVFVYVCAQSSKKAFDSMVKKYELKGDNYYLTDEQFQSFDKEAKISGFPTYMVITKEGKLVRNGIRRPSAGPELINQLKEFASRK